MGAIRRELDDIRTIPNELSILIRMDSFSFMIIDQSNIVSVYETIPFKTEYDHFRYIDPIEILSIVQSNNLRHTRFEKVHISVDHDAYTYVPGDLYEQSAWYEYLSFVSTGISKDDVASTKTEGEVYCVYAYPLPIRKLLSTLYPTSQVHHLSESMTAFLKREVSEDPTLFSIAHGNSQHLMVFENKHLTLINTYHAPTADDQLYYILTACKHRNLNLRKANLRVTGDEGLVQDLKEDLSKYFIHIASIDWKNGWRLPLSVKNPMELFEFYCMHHANHWR